MHVGQQFTCGRKKDSESDRSDTDSLSARVTCFAQSHTLFTCLFAPVLPIRTYMYSTITHAGGLALVRTYVCEGGIELLTYNK